MNNRIMEAIETIEERIENIKWMIITSSLLKRTGITETLSLIKRSAGILGKDSLKGTAFETKIRKEWKANALKRLS